MTKPVFDPTKPFTPAGTQVQEKPKFNPNQKFEPVGKEAVVVTKPGFNPYERTAQEEKSIAIGAIVNDLSFSEGYNDDEKAYLKDLANNNPDLTFDEWNNAKLSMGGEHPLQGGDQRYYMDKNSKGIYVPIPVAYGQRPPKGKQIESIWGTQESAEDDGIMTTIGKNLAATIPSLIQGFADVGQMPYGLITGKEADWYINSKNRLDALMPKTSSASNQQFLETENIYSAGDLANPDNWNFTADNIAGNISKLASTVLQFMGGGAAVKGLGVGAKAIGAVEAAGLTGAEVAIGTRMAAKSPYFVGSYITNLGEALDAADEAGVTGRDKYAVASMVTIPVSMMDMTLGLTSKLISNPALAKEKNEMIKGLIKGWKESGGQVTKESLDELYKVTQVGASSVMGKLAKETAQTSASEAGQEVLQNAMQRASQQVYDNMYAEDRRVGEGRYGKEIANAEALADYINDAIAGAMGGGVGGAGISKYRRAKAEMQSENAYEYVKQGDQGVQALKAQIGSAMKAGRITKSEYDLGIYKVDTYKKYFDQTNDLDLDDVSRRRVFDLTWSNENLKVQQEELMNNPESKIKGTIPHRRLLDTEAILEANSKEVSELMATKIADQQTAVATSVDEKLKEKPKPIGKVEPTKDTAQNTLIQQIHSAETEKDLDAYMKEADQKGLTNPDIIDSIGKRRSQIIAQENAPEEHKAIHKVIDAERPGKDFNNTLDWDHPDKSDVLVKHLLETGQRTIKDGVLELGMWANKVVNKKKLPLYYDIDLSGKRFKIASSDYTNLIKEKNLQGRKVDLQLVLPTDSDLDQLAKDNVVDSHQVVERTGKDGQKRKYFVFDEDTHKQRYPFVIVARLQTKDGESGIKIGNLATNTYSEATQVIEGREGLRRPKKENQQKEGDKETVVAPETKGVNIPFEEREVDYEAQLEQAEETTIENEDEGFTVKNEENGTEPKVERTETGSSEKDSPAPKTEKVKVVRAGNRVPKAKRKIRNPLAIQALKLEVTSPYDKVLQYFIKGGKISPKAIDEIFGGAGKSTQSEKKLRIGLLNKSAPSWEALGEKLWESRTEGDESFDGQDYSNAVEEVIIAHNGTASMINELLNKYSEKENAEEIDEIYITPELSDFADEALDIWESLSEEDQAILASEAEIPEDFWNRIIPEDKEEDEDLDDNKGPVYQKESSMGKDTDEAFKKKIDLLKKSLPGIEVVMDDSIDLAGQLDADGKTVRLNPAYNSSDTPIHEFGHALIDIMGGTKNKVVAAGVNQLRDTDLWKETAEKYPELSEEMLAKEVLAEAIGREGAKIFANRESRSKFMNWLDGFFYAIKRLLGIDKNVAKKLASQLLAGKKISSQTVATGETQKKKVDQKKDIISKFKQPSFKKWSADRGYTDLDAKARIAEIKAELKDADPEKQVLLEGEMELIEQSQENIKQEYEDYLADRKKAIELVNSGGDVSAMTIDQLYEAQAALSKYDDIVRTKVYKNILYSIGERLQQERIDEIKNVNPDFDPEKDTAGDLKKSDVYMQGLSTMSEKFPAIQKFYKMYRGAYGSMSTEITGIRTKAEKLAQAVIKEYQKEHGIGERLKNFTIGGGNKYFSYMAKDGVLLEKGSPEYNKLSKAQKDLLDFVIEEKAKLDEHMEADKNVLLKSGAGFWETFQKQGLFKAYANYITSNYNLRNVKVKYKDPETGKVTDEYFGDVENLLATFAKKGHIQKIQAGVLLTKYNLAARAGLSKKVHSDGEAMDGRGGKGKFFLAPDGKLISMFSGDFKGDFTENYYETFMKYAQDAVFSKHMSPLMPTLTGVEMFYKAMGSKAENVSAFLDVVKKGRFLGETKESGLGEGIDAALRLLRKWTSWRFIAFNIPANIWNVAVGEYNQFRSDGGKTYLKGKKRFFESLAKGKKNAKAINILKKYAPEMVLDTDRIDPEKHIGRYFDMLAFGGQQLGETLIRGGAVIGRMSREHYNWFDNKGNIKGSPEEVKEREAIIKAEIEKYRAEVEKVQGRYSNVDKRNFAYYELGQFFGQFKVWLPEWMSERFANKYIDADGVTRVGSVTNLWNYGMRDFMRDVTKKEFYTSNDPKHLSARKQLRGMIITATLIGAYLSASDDEEDKDMAHMLDKALQNISSIYRMDNNQFMISQPAAAMATVTDFAKAVNAAFHLSQYKKSNGDNEAGDFKAPDMFFNLIPGKNLVKNVDALLTDNE